MHVQEVSVQNPTSQATQPLHQIYSLPAFILRPYCSQGFTKECPCIHLLCSYKFVSLSLGFFNPSIDFCSAALLPSLLSIHPCKALIAHLVSISGLSADNWSITPPKSRNRRRKAAAAMFRRTATLAKHGRARLSLEPRPNGDRRRVPPFGSWPRPPSSLAHALSVAAVT